MTDMHSFHRVLCHPASPPPKKHRLIMSSLLLCTPVKCVFVGILTFGLCNFKCVLWPKQLDLFFKNLTYISTIFHVWKQLFIYFQTFPLHWAEYFYVPLVQKVAVSYRPHSSQVYSMEVSAAVWTGCVGLGLARGRGTALLLIWRSSGPVGDSVWEAERDLIEKLHLYCSWVL